jgi:hypothetical protein
VTLSELCASLALILSLEEDWPVDWPHVHNLSAALASDLCSGPLTVSLDPFVLEYLSGWELRRDDPVFAHSQRSSLAAFIRSDH